MFKNGGRGFHLSRDVGPTLTGVVVLLALATGSVVLTIHHGAKAGSSLLWALACTGLGGLIGFLFGIPRTVQAEPARPWTGSAGAPPAAAKPAPYRMQVNTNLERVSDWLTTIFVGLTLTQLQEIPDRLVRAAAFVAGGPSATDLDRTMAGALISYFSIVGFLGGYLLTRLFLASAFSLADQASQRALQDWIDEVDEASQDIAPSQATEVPTKEQVAVAERIGELSLRTDRSVVREQVLTLAREYERTRSAMTAGAERTRRMETVVTRMRTLALAGHFLIPELQDSESVGARLACIAFLQVKPDATCLPWLAERLAREKPFVSYQAAVALRAAAQSLEDRDLGALKAAIERGQEFLAGQAPDTGRDRTLASTAEELEARLGKMADAISGKIAVVGRASRS